MSESKSNRMKIVILGDSGVGKTTLINSYVKIKDENQNNLLAQNTTYKRIDKTLQNYKFTLDFYEFNLKNDKIISYIQSSNAVIVIIDLNNRNSFDNLNEYWLRFLRDDCYYENGVCIFGNYFDKTSPTLTTTEEITDMIGKFGISANYIEIGSKHSEDLNLLIDKLITNAYEDEIKSLKASECKGESFKRCLIY